MRWPPYLFIPFKLQKTCTCFSDIGIALEKTIQCTTSLQGGVVRLPRYQKYPFSRSRGRSSAMDKGLLPSNLCSCPVGIWRLETRVKRAVLTALRSLTAISIDGRVPTTNHQQRYRHARWQTLPKRSSGLCWAPRVMRPQTDHWLNRLTGRRTNQRSEWVNYWQPTVNTDSTQISANCHRCMSTYPCK